MTAHPPTLAELNEARMQADHAISEHYLVLLAGYSAAQHADWHQRMYELHEHLVTVLEATERASWSCADVWNVSGALRWAVTGARLAGERFRDSGIEWRKIATGEF